MSLLYTILGILTLCCPWYACSLLSLMSILCVVFDVPTLCCPWCPYSVLSLSSLLCAALDIFALYYPWYPYSDRWLSFSIPRDLLFVFPRSPSQFWFLCPFQWLLSSLTMIDISEYFPYFLELERHKDRDKSWSLLTVTSLYAAQICQSPLLSLLARFFFFF